VSGRRRGIGSALLRGLLRAAEGPYGWAMRLRNRRYDTGAAVVHRMGVPVVSVGNLTLGGTGKTPMVEWLARWFLDHGVSVGVVSRGYAARALRNATASAAKGEKEPRAPLLNDEARELALRLPGVPHVQNPDRVAAACEAIAEHHCQALVLDDAFQHRRIGRDLDIVLLDAMEPFGFGHVFPRGTLREPLAGLARADIVALSRADMLQAAGDVDTRSGASRLTLGGAGRMLVLPTAADIRRQVERYNPRAAWVELSHAPRSLTAASRAEQTLQSLAGQRVAAFCGIGNPSGFRHTLDQCDYQVADFREFSDHYAYTSRDIESLAAWAESLAVMAVLCTQKDLVKLGIDRLGSRPLWAVSIGLEVLAGREELEARLKAVLPGRTALG
jgi:tetraacyldisaccharide 4'-kinase